MMSKVYIPEKHPYLSLCPMAGSMEPVLDKFKYEKISNETHYNWFLSKNSIYMLTIVDSDHTK